MDAYPMFLGLLVLWGSFDRRRNHYQRLLGLFDRMCTHINNGDSRLTHAGKKG